MNNTITHADTDSVTSFAPILYLNNVADAIAFYQKAFSATELRRFGNDDGTVHVAELKIGDALFRLHEETVGKNELSPVTFGGTCIVLGLFVADPDQITAQAITAGAILTSPVQDYDYGYRQGNITDPFGHHWTIERRI